LLFKIGSNQSINVQQIAFGLFKSVIIILFGLLLGCVCFWGNVIVLNKPYMSTVKFILSKSQHQRKVNSKSSMVMLRYTHNKQSVLFFTHKNIDDDCWDNNNQCSKKSYPSHLSFNTYLRTFKQKIDDIVNQCFINSQNPTTVLVKQLFVQQQNNIASTSVSFFDYCNQFIEQSKKHKCHSTIKTYKTIVNKLVQYQKYANVNLHWDSFNLSFYYDFLHFYTSVQGYHTNGFGRAIRILKGILNDAFDKNIHQNTAYKHKKFKVLTEEVNNIYLTQDELQCIISLDLSSNPTMQGVRDAFIIGCYTGLRISDIAKINKEHVCNNTIKIKTQKTDQWVTIPLLEPVRNIMLSYRSSANGFPTVCCSLTMNKYLKQIGELAGLSDVVIKVRSKGKTRVEQRLPKYQLITTHTARRSFATNLFKKGVPSRVIMLITGHKTEKSFNSYIKINSDENAELLLSYLSNDNLL